MNIWNKIFVSGLGAAAVGGAGMLFSKFFGSNEEALALDTGRDESLEDLDAVDNATSAAQDDILG